MGILIVALLSGCSNVGVASSWPGLSVSEDTGFFSYGTQVFAIDIKNGEELWRFPREADAKEQFFAAPGIGEDRIVVGSYSNLLYSINKNSGAQQWIFDKADDKYIASPLIVEEYVFAPNTDGFLYVLDGDGAISWKFKTKGPNWTTPVTDGSHVFLASMDHFLYAFNLAYSPNSLVASDNGETDLLEQPLWQIDLGAAVVSNPIIKDEIIYVGTIDGKMFAINTANHEIVWVHTYDQSAASIWGTPVILDGALMYGDEKGFLFAISLEDGTPLWSSPYEAGASLIASGVEIEENKAVFLTDDGKLFTINLDKEPQPILTLDTVMYASPIFSNGRIVLAPAAKDALFKAVDTEGRVIWNFNPSK